MLNIRPSVTAALLQELLGGRQAQKLNFRFSPVVRADGCTHAGALSALRLPQISQDSTGNPPSLYWAKLYDL